MWGGSHPELVALRFACPPEVLPFFGVVLLLSKNLLYCSMEEKKIPAAVKTEDFPHMECLNLPSYELIYSDIYVWVEGVGSKLIHVTAYPL